MRTNKVLALLFLLSAASVWAVERATDATKKRKLTLQDLFTKAGSSSPRTPAVAGVRGLEETSGDVDTHARDYAAIERLNAMVIHADELKVFMQEGKLK